MLHLTETRHFTNKNVVVKQMIKVITFYSKKFTKNDLKIARKNIDIPIKILKKKDAAILSYFSGLLSVLLPIILYWVFTTTDLDNRVSTENDCWSASLPIFRGAFMAIVLLGGAGLCMHLFRLFEINYIYIFEFDPYYKINHV